MVKSARRALEIIDLITSLERSTTFAAIGHRLQIPDSSLHALLVTLVTAGWLEHHERERTYSLGLRALAAGNAYLRTVSLPERAQPIAEQLRDEFGDTVQVAVRDGRHIVYVVKVDGHGAVNLASEVGRRFPAHATALGKALLSDLAREEFDMVLADATLERLTSNTFTDREALYEELTRIKAQGFSVDEEEFSEGVRGVAVPVRDQSRRVVAALSVAGLKGRISDDRKQHMIARLREASTALSQAMGDL